MECLSFSFCSLDSFYRRPKKPRILSICCTLALTKLRNVNYFIRCGPCRDFAGTFESLSAKYDNAVFIKVDVEECEGVGAKFQVASLPTFVLLKEKKKVDSVSGADKQQLEAKILIYYKDASKEDCGVKGMVSQPLTF